MHMRRKKCGQEIVNKHVVFMSTDYYYVMLCFLEYVWTVTSVVSFSLMSQ